LPDSLYFRRDGNIGILRLSRPEKRNALDDDTVRVLGSFFRELPDGIGAVVLHGEGEHFSAGLDLGEVVGTTSLGDGIRHSQMWHRAFHEIQFGQVPVISVLHGAVVGGGLELAAATHIRVAERSAFYALPEGQRGIFLGGGGSVRIPRLIGVARVQDMMLTGRALSAEEGHAAGISQYLVAPGEGLVQGIELARKAAGNTPMTNFAVVHALPRAAEGDPATGLLAESLMAAIAETTPEAQQRLRAFLEKRAGKVSPQV
jgi:enoyl-CoA hydratase/carnithine racemase